MGFTIMTKSKNRSTKWEFFHENHQLGKVVPVGFSRTETERLKNWSEKCERPKRGGGTTG
jgi:hypothetical protein